MADFRYRFSRKMVKGRKVTPISITTRDLEFFKLLSDIKYVPLDYAWKLVGGKDLQSFSKRASRLYLNGYIDFPSGQTRSQRANYNFRIAALDEKGAKYLEDRGFTVPKLKRFKNMEHKTLGCVFRLSMLIADAELVSWNEMLSSPNLPDQTRHNPNPETILFTHDGARYSITPDDLFLIGYPKSFRFYVREDDCDTESDWSDAKNTIKFKVLAYLSILRDRLYEQHFGTSTFYVLFHTVGSDRVVRIKRTIQRVVEEYNFDPKLAAHILVKHTPIYTAYDENPKPAGPHVYDEPWERVGHKPLYLNQEGVQ